MTGAYKTLFKGGIVLKSDKMKLEMSEVNFMGHLLRNRGLKLDPAKVESIMKMP